MIFKIRCKKYSYWLRTVTSFNFLPPDTRELSPTLFKKAARTHILENREDYLNMTRNHNIVGHKHKKDPNPEPSNKLKETKKKRLNIDKFYPNQTGFTSGLNTPVKRYGGAKAWFPYFKPKLPTGINLNQLPNTPQKVTTELYQQALQGKKVPLCLKRLQWLLWQIS